MFLLISILLTFLSALILLGLRIWRPNFRFAWLTALAGTSLSWISVLLWQARIPLELKLLPWQPSALFPTSPAFFADRLAWIYAVSLGALAVAYLLTASVRSGFPNAPAWAISLALCGLGLLAVTAENPLTLALVWGALDLVELTAMLWSVSERQANERVVIAFSARAVSILLLLMADVTASALTTSGQPIEFQTIPPQAGLLLLLAAGLRVGVLPLHLPYTYDASLRRGMGTILRLVSAASSLALLSRVTITEISSPLTWLLLALTVVAALYAGWMWLRAPDEMAGRPFWIIGIGGLGVACALQGNPVGATAWGVVLILAGGSLFLASVQSPWLNRTLLIGTWALSSLPFSLTASAWQTNGFDPLLPFLMLAQAFLIAGFAKHAMRPSTRVSLDAQPVWAKSIYPLGIGLLPGIQLVLGLWGWNGAFQMGALFPGVAASILTLGLLWATPRFPILNPVRAHWLRPAVAPGLDRLYRALWSLYRFLARLSLTISEILEGQGGIMWTLLFLILFVSLIAQRRP